MADLSNLTYPASHEYLVTMKFKVKWTATYETVIEAEDLNAARDAAADIDVSVPGSAYVEDSWEVESIAQNL